MPATKKTWLVTGASSGLGQALTAAILASGDRVAGTFRGAAAAAKFQAAAGANAVGIELDVTNAGQIPRAVAQAIDGLGHIDVLINNAGHGQFGAIEDLSDRQIRSLFETNFFGLLNVTRAVLPHMRSRGTGRIVNISSSAGFKGVGGAGIYSASKFAVEGMSEALAAEVAPFGIGVTIVEPGSFRTLFATTSMDLDAAVSAVYRPTIGPIHEYLTKIYPGTEIGDPVKGAAAMIKALTASNPPQRLILGEDSYRGARTKLEEVKTELDRWESLSLSTSFESKAK